MEEFRDIPYATNYQVSNIGRVRNKKTKRTVVQQLNRDKYYVIRSCNISLYNNNNIRQTYKIHRLVAHTFIPNHENKPLVDHIDRDPSNNNITNLRWATYLENSHNRNKQRNNTSGDTNIFHIKSSNTYRIIFCTDGIITCCGTYNTYDEAKIAKDTGVYKKLCSNVNEKYITYNSNKKRYIFNKQIGIKQKNVVSKYHTKSFLTLQEAVEYRDNFLKTL
jgi:hypothetical protein